MAPKIHGKRKLVLQCPYAAPGVAHRFVDPTLQLKSLHELRVRCRRSSQLVTRPQRHLSQGQPMIAMKAQGSKQAVSLSKRRVHVHCSLVSGSGFGPVPTPVQLQTELHCSLCIHRLKLQRTGEGRSSLRKALGIMAPTIPDHEPFT